LTHKANRYTLEVAPRAIVWLERKVHVNPLRILRAVLLLACLTPLASLANPVLAQEQVFTETFDDPALPGWESSPNATVVDGVLRIEPDGFAMHMASWADMILTVRVRIAGEGDLLIRYRWSEDGNYAVRLSRPFVTVQRQLLGPATDLGEGTAPLPLGEWVEVTVTVDGDWHHVMVNGSPVLIATDPDPLPEGGIGFFVEGDAVGEFDNLEVTSAGQAPPAASPTVPPMSATPTTTMPELQPTAPPEAAPTPAGGGGICPGAAALPLALMGLVCLSGRRR
jgi:hypothetical protein